MLAGFDALSIVPVAAFAGKAASALAGSVAATAELEYGSTAASTLLKAGASRTLIADTMSSLVPILFEEGAPLANLFGRSAFGSAVKKAYAPVIEKVSALVGEQVGASEQIAIGEKLIQSELKNFVANKATPIILQQDTVVYRVFGGNSLPLGGQDYGTYMTLIKPTSPAEAIEDLALKASFKNTAEKIEQITLPKGTVIWEGTAAAQGPEALGGGNQIWVPTRFLSASWIKPVKWTH